MNRRRNLRPGPPAIELSSRSIPGRNSSSFTLLCLLFGALFVLAVRPAHAASYPVNLPFGFRVVANHLPAASIQTLLGAPGGWPQVLEMQAIFPTSPYVPSPTDVFINDGSAWFDEITGDPAIKTIGQGEAMFIFNPMQFQINATISGPANPSIVQLNPTVPGFHLRGRQNIGPGTFESTFGRSPRDYAFVHAYRWVGNDYVVYQFANSANPANRRWSPSAPVLPISDGMWFSLGASTGPANPNYFAPNPNNFTITGVTPANGNTVNSPVALSVTGSGLANGDQLRLQPMSGGPQTPWTAGVADPDGYVLTAPMNVGSLQKGYYRILVRKPSGLPQSLDNVFYLDTPGTQLTVNLTGPNLALAGSPSPLYQLTVSNPSGLPVNNVNISVVVPGYPGNVSVTLGPVTVSPGFGTPPVSQVGGPGVQTQTAFTIPAGGAVSYTFSINPSLSLITVPATALQLVGQITTPVPQANQSIRMVEVVASMDPNAKTGPVGSGPARYITGLDPSDYTITFENKPTASAPAHEVFLTDQLDPNRFNLSTFELGEIRFGPKIITPPNGLQFWSTTVPYDVDGNPLTLDDNIVVGIDAALDADINSPTYGKVSWTFRSLESAPPNLPVQLPQVGFLPANVNPPEGQGSVSFRVNPSATVDSGDTLENEARIVFDNNDPILTGEWVNTIDLDAPTSSVTSLPATQPTTSFTVNWSGSDAHSGVASYDVYVSDNAGPFTLWMPATTATSALFNGEMNHAYRFYSVALDRVGNREAEPESPDTETRLSVPTVSYSLTFSPGFSTFVSQLDHGGNTLAEVFSDVPEMVQVMKLSCSGGVGEHAYFDGIAWVDDGGLASTMILKPGEGAFIVTPDEMPMTLTFTGTVPAVSLPPELPCGCGRTNFLGRATLGIGTYENIVGAAPSAGAKVSRFLNNSWIEYQFDGETWEPEEPQLAIGEAALVYIPCRDTTPPAITCPANIEIISATNVAAAYAPTAIDGCAGSVVVVCSPPSGTFFAPGTTNLVTCTATDACGNTNACSFVVTVIRGRGDLWIEDTPYYYTGAPDTGAEPEPNLAEAGVWASRGIWMHMDCSAPAGDFTSHQNPRYGGENCVFTLIRNRGNLPIAGAKVEILYVNASLGLSWPAQWLPIGIYTLPEIKPGDSHVAQLSWTPPGTGHFCLIARILSDDDPITTPEGLDIVENVRANNNIAWRNVNVAECLTVPAHKFEVRVRNFQPARKLLSLVFTADQDFLPAGGEAILHPGDAIFERWQAAGAQGVNVQITNGNEILLTGSPARMDGIPFKEEEERIFNLTLRADQPLPVPGSNHVFHASLQQVLDGSVVGGVDYVIVARGLDADTDHDGIPDVTDDDDDGDGVTDREDSTPLGQSDCPPAAIAINRVDSRVSLTWSGLGYKLQGTSDFSQWDDLTTSSPATLRTDTPYRFFRLICR